MSDRVEQLREAFAAGKRDRKDAMRDFKPDYVHHSNLLGDVHGLDEYFEKWMPMFDAIQMQQEIVDIVEHDPFVVCTVLVTSSMKPEPTRGVHIYRWEGDRVAELWSLSDPQ
jgi:predicted ester cyclase